MAKGSLTLALLALALCAGAWAEGIVVKGVPFGANVSALKAKGKVTCATSADVPGQQTCSFTDPKLRTYGGLDTLVQAYVFVGGRLDIVYMKFELRRYERLVDLMDAEFGRSDCIGVYPKSCIWKKGADTAVASFSEGAIDLLVTSGEGAEAREKETERRRSQDRKDM